jgi:hypothetical protein
MIKEDPTVKEEPKHSGYVGVLDPLEYKEDPIFIIEVGVEKYLYNNIMACLKDMITLDEPVYVYRYDPTHQRYSRYVVIEQPEESK